MFQPPQFCRQISTVGHTRLKPKSAYITRLRRLWHQVHSRFWVPLLVDERMLLGKTEFCWEGVQLCLDSLMYPQRVSRNCSTRSMSACAREEAVLYAPSR